MKLLLALLVSTLILVCPAHAKTPGEVDAGSPLCAVAKVFKLKL